MKDHIYIIAEAGVNHNGDIGIAKRLVDEAAAAGADGIMIEVHNDPVNALCDGAQSLTPEQFADVADKVRKIREVAAE